ncbi:hypothetical protein YDYSY3_39030 [Paenibacillus chitinolyticus]|uniref:papain-like cysteine protease family protein n=1 Tax=Paenibacillus chitinolyticus TaxID=79263 RepID=UPI0026E4CA7B|nr:papain-like cysteine protease family protein [Paenibacillus chitinolyticus]GKS12903.1 hypothetical protein YDYSY3_39030 [Paenibacillus chitinolyticus]
MGKLKGVNVLSLGIASALFLSFTGSAGATALNTPKIKQEGKQWCWVASSQMILQFFGKTSVSQCSLYKTGKGTTTCDDYPGTDSQAQKAMYENGVSTYRYTSALSFDDLAAQVFSSSQPVYIHWDWGNGTGHAVVAKYTETNNNTQYVSYNDPGEGTSHTMSYTSFKGGSGYDRTWVSGLKDAYKYK